MVAHAHEIVYVVAFCEPLVRRVHVPVKVSALLRWIVIDDICKGRYDVKFIPCAASRDVDRHQTTHLAHLSRWTNTFWVVILVVTQFLFVICRSSAVVSSLAPVRPLPVRVRQLEVQNEILFIVCLTFSGEVEQHVARETRRGRRRRCRRRTRQTRNGRRREWVLTGQKNVRWWIGCRRIRCLFDT